MNLRGYISSRELSDGTFVDQSIQNMIIKQACEKRSYTFQLSATEYGMSECYLMLEKIIEDLKQKNMNGIAFYSIYQLPPGKLRTKLFKEVIKRRKIILFCYQNILIKNFKDIEKLNELVGIIEMLKFSPKNISSVK